MSDEPRHQPTPPDVSRAEELSEDPSTLTPEPEERRRRGPRVALILGVLLVVAIGGAYLAGYVLAGDKLPRNTTVAGIGIGGLTAPEAEAKLAEEYAPVVTAPMKVTIEETVHELLPADSGLGVDYAATVHAGGAGKSLNPLHIWRVLTGGGPIEPVVEIDDNRLTEAVGGLAGEINKPAVDATATFEGAEIQRTPGEQAVELQQDDLVAALRGAYPDATEVTGEVRRIDPIVTDAKIDEAVEAYAKPALQGPVKVDTGQGVFDVTPAMIGNASEFAVEDSSVVGKTDATKLFENAQPAIKKLELKQARNARYKFEGGAITVTPSTDGAELTKENFEKAVMPVLLTTERQVTAELKVTKPKLTTELAEAQKPKQVIGEFTTYYPHAAYRNTNLTLAASRINGTTVAVGDVFSLDRTLGSRSGGGYVDGWVVSGSRLKRENAGGISQSATTVFNAGWFAGLEDVQHQPHTMYFDRYPAGRESTIYSGHIDVKFRNTTDNAIYIQSYTNKSAPGGRGSITVKIWGTKKWDIESPEPRKSNFYSGRTITDNGADCNPQSASPGFTATYYRLFKVNGQVVKREDKSWKYNATDEIRCTRG
ncbi:MAG: VanW family protein [Propionibacteriaceae bacterium]|nr:VanW family protein [Propionibacteriaceae bacterium]